MQMRKMLALLFSAFCFATLTLCGGSGKQPTSPTEPTLQPAPAAQVAVTDPTLVTGRGEAQKKDDGLDILIDMEGNVTFVNRDVERTAQVCWYEDHNGYDKPTRQTLVDEVKRLLKPGETVILSPGVHLSAFCAWQTDALDGDWGRKCPSGSDGDNPPTFGGAKQIARYHVERECPVSTPPEETPTPTPPVPTPTPTPSPTPTTPTPTPSPEPTPTPTLEPTPTPEPSPTPTPTPVPTPTPTPECESVGHSCQPYDSDCCSGSYCSWPTWKCTSCKATGELCSFDYECCTDKCGGSWPRKCKL